MLLQHNPQEVVPIYASLLQQPQKMVVCYNLPFLYTHTSSEWYSAGFIFVRTVLV